MSYSVNPSAFRSIFAVPSEIVDKHIRVASAHQLRVLLWILRHSPDNPDIEFMCKDLNMAYEDAVDYLQYWVKHNVISSTESLPVQKNESVNTPQVTPAVAVSHVAEEKKVVHVEMFHSKPTSSEIAQRLEESPEIGHLFNEAQVMLGKTIGYDGQCTLLLLHDHYGLPAEVLFMLIEYCVSINKTNYSYIEAVGKDWGTKEIDTIDKAAEQISSLRKAGGVWKEFAKYAGISTPNPTAAQISYLRKWSEEWKFSFEMITRAYDEMANHTGKLSFAYMDKVLTSWNKKNIRTIKDIEKETSDFEAKKNTKPSHNTPPVSQNASYDIDEFKKQSINGELKYERKKRKKNELQQ